VICQEDHGWVIKVTPQWAMSPGACCKPDDGWFLTSTYSDTRSVSISRCLRLRMFPGRTWKQLYGMGLRAVRCTRRYMETK